MSASILSRSLSQVARSNNRISAILSCLSSSASSSSPSSSSFSSCLSSSSVAASAASSSFSTSSQLSRGTLQVVSSPDAPKAIGPYSQGIKANGFVFVSGCLGIEPKSGEIKGDIVQQTNQAMANMKAVLIAADSSFGQVVKTTILLADIKDFPKVNEAYGKYFPASPPARATYAVKDLPKGGLVEIEAVAVHN